MLTVPLVVASLPDDYAHRALQFIGKHLDSSSHIEFYLQWACTLLSVHGPKDNVLSHNTLLTLHQSLNRKYEQLSKVCDFNKYTLKVLSAMPSPAVQERENSDDDDQSDTELLLVQSNGQHNRNEMEVDTNE